MELTTIITAANVIVLVVISVACVWLIRSRTSSGMVFTPEARNHALWPMAVGYSLWAVAYALDATCEATGAGVGFCVKDPDRTHPMLGLVLWIGQNTAFLVSGLGFLGLEKRSHPGLREVPVPRPSLVRRRGLWLRGRGIVLAAYVELTVATILMMVHAVVTFDGAPPILVELSAAVPMALASLLSWVTLAGGLEWELTRLRKDIPSLTIVWTYALYGHVALTLYTLLLFDPKEPSDAYTTALSAIRFLLIFAKMILLLSIWAFRTLVQLERRLEAVVVREAEVRELAFDRERAAILAAKGLFSGARHEVRNTLSRLDDCLDRLKSCQNMSDPTLVDDFRLDITNLRQVVLPLLERSSEISFKLVRVDLEKFLPAQCESASKDYEVRVHFEGPLQGAVESDPLVIEVAMRRIIENAVRHGGAAHVHVRLHEQDGAYRLTLENDGRPIPAASEGLLFADYESGLGAARYLLRHSKGDLSFRRGAEGRTCFVIALRGALEPAR